MKKIPITLAVLLLFSTIARSEPYCKVVLEPLAWQGGEFDIIGKHPITGKTYAGTLEVTAKKNTYNLTRTVNGHTIYGTAWDEVCSPDKFVRLRVSWHTKTNKPDYECYFRGDSDNLIRSSCVSENGKGLEAWFEKSQ